MSVDTERGGRRTSDWGDQVNQPTGHLTMAQLLAVLLERLPEWPPIEHDEKKIRAALEVLIREPEWQRGCRRDIETALTLIEKNELSRRRPEQNKRAIAQLLAALKKAQTAKAKLPWLQIRQFENVCNLQAGLAICEHEKDEQNQAAPRKPRASSHRQFDAVQTAHHLVQLWLVVRHGIYEADELSDQSPWYKLSAILFGKDVNMLSHMRRYRNAMDRVHAAVALGDDGKRVRRKPSQIVPVSDAGGG
jgi:hypothetical protein